MNTLHETANEHNARRDDLEVVLANIPAELKPLRQWVLYRLGPISAKGKRDKTPINPHTGDNAAVNDPATWGSLDDVTTAYRRGNSDGIGFVFTESDPYVGIDLDKCRDPNTGHIQPWALDIMQRVNSYTDASPSETGIHILAKGKLPGGGGKEGQVEMYEKGRFFTMTGEHIAGTPTTCEERQETITDLYRQYFPHKINGNGFHNGKSTQSNMSDAERRETLAELKEALPSIPAVEHDVWLQVGMGLHFLDSSEASFALWVEWSKTCPEKFDLADCLKRWRSFHNDGGVTHKSIFALAIKHGWQSNGHGDFSTFDLGADDDDEQETEEEENERVLREERPIDDPYPCPDHLFRGPFRRVAAEMGKQTWEVWAATCVALGAKAHRDIAYRYHRMLYGMMYALIIKGTGMGKGLSTDLCRGLMPNWYVIRDAVQSGPALAPLLADIVRDKKGKVESCTSHPALLLIEEFTVLLKNAGIQHSTLIDSLNGLFHRTWPWNISRTDRPNGGGGDVVIHNPTLSILATTTEALFKEYVSPQMIRSGFLNRYLVLPGDSTPWKFYDPDGAGKIIEQNLGILDYIPIRKVGDGKTVWQAYEPSALERMRNWGEQTFETVMQSSDLEAESVKRLHVYAHVICLLYAWGEGRDLVNIDDVECSIAVIETSQRFLQSLISEERDPEVPKFKAYEINLEQKILAKVKAEAQRGIRRRKVVQSLAGKTATSPDINLLISKMVQAGALKEVEEQTEGARKKTHKLFLPECAPRRPRGGEK